MGTDQRVVINRAVNALEKLDAVVKNLENTIERVTQLEKVIESIIPAINKTFSNTNQQISEAVEVLDAVVKTLGPATIEVAMVEERKAKATQEMERQKNELSVALAEGSLVSVDKVTEKSLIVGKETNPDGNIRHPGRVQVVYSRVEADFQAKLLGQAVGYVLELPTGGKFEVVEVFEEVTKSVAPPASQAVVEAVPSQAKEG
jgi:hypothetical protein